MKQTMFVSLILLVVFVSRSFGEDKRIYFCDRLIRTPVLDGKIANDPAWEGIQAATEFVELGSDTSASKQTSFKIGYTPEALFIGIECEEPELTGIKAVAKDGDIRICVDDSVELFIIPGGAQNYYQFMINAIGSRWSYEFVAVFAAGPEIPLANWQAKTCVGGKHWSVEIKIPWEVFLAIPEREEKWRVNVCRNTCTAKERHTTWAHLKGNFHQPTDFGGIVFRGTILPDEGRETKTRIINSLRKKITRSLEELSEFRKEVSERRKQKSSLHKELSSFVKDFDEISNGIPGLGSAREANLLRRKSRDLLSVAEELRGEILRQDIFAE